ncbi:MAG TPA: hypothetical protein VIH90_08505 [Candidatus Saccharimonadales bacterium]
MINLVSNERLVIPDPRQIFSQDQLIEGHIVGTYEQVEFGDGTRLLVPEYTGRVLGVYGGSVMLEIHTKGQELGQVENLYGPYTYQGQNIDVLPPTDHRGYEPSLAFMSLVTIGTFNVVGDAELESEKGKWRCSATIDMTK